MLADENDKLETMSNASTVATLKDVKPHSLYGQDMSDQLQLEESKEIRLTSKQQ